MKEAFPDSCDWRGFVARTHYVPAAAPFDESSRPRHCPCSRLQSCTFAPSHRALGHLTPGWAWCRWCERWRGCSGRLRPSTCHAGGWCSGTESALGCAAGRRFHASLVCIRCRAGCGAREAWARSIALRGRRRRPLPRAHRAPSTEGSSGRWRAATSRLSTWPLPSACLLLFPGVVVVGRDGQEVQNE